MTAGAAQHPTPRGLPGIDPRVFLRRATAAALLALPTGIGFFSGGYFDEPRLVAALVAWLAVAVTALVGDRPLPRSRAARVAVAGLAGLTAWTGLSLVWAPLSVPALDDAQRAVLYLGTLAAATALLRERWMQRAVEPALAAGALVVVGYGLAGRLLPSVVEQEASGGAAGRLEQPLTYWNATGALAAMGLLLCTRIAGDSRRARALRVAAAAGGVALALGAYLSFSRGALVALAAGCVALLAFAPSRGQARSLAVVLGAGVLASLATIQLPAVRSTVEVAAARERDGAVMLAVLVLLGAAAAAAQAVLAGAEARGTLPPRRLGLARRPAVIAVAAMLIAGGLAGAALPQDGGGTPEGSGPSRLGSTQTNRYAYWEVALRAFAREPLIGVGAGSFQAEWLHEREIAERVADAHSLYLETAAELGIVGLAALAALFTGVFLALRAVLLRGGGIGPGAAAVLVAWAVHAGVDWDWEMPAVTLVAVILAGGVLAAMEEGDAGADAAV